MKEDSIEDLKKKLAKLEEENKRLRLDNLRNHRVCQVMVAAGVISGDKLEQARSIVDDLAG